MTKYYTSYDGVEEKYYVDVSCADLDSGKTQIDFIIPEKYELVPESKYLNEFYVLNFLTDAFSALSSTFGVLGIGSFSVLSVMSFLALAEQTLYVVIAGVCLFVMSGIFIASMLLSNNVGQLLGFSLGCLILWIMMKTCIVEDEDTGKPVMSKVGQKFFEAITGYWKFHFALSLIVQSLCLIFTLIFPENDVLADVLWFVANIFSLFPLIVGAYAAIWALNFGMLLHAYYGKSSSTAFKIYMYSYKIYENKIFIVALVGFLLFGIKLQSDLTDGT